MKVGSGAQILSFASTIPAIFFFLFSFSLLLERRKAKAFIDLSSRLHLWHSLEQILFFFRVCSASNVIMIGFFKRDFLSTTDSQITHENFSVKFGIILNLKLFEKFNFLEIFSINFGSAEPRRTPMFSNVSLVMQKLML